VPVPVPLLLRHIYAACAWSMCFCLDYDPYLYHLIKKKCLYLKKEEEDHLPTSPWSYRLPASPTLLSPSPACATA